MQGFGFSLDKRIAVEKALSEYTEREVFDRWVKEEVNPFTLKLEYAPKTGNGLASHPNLKKSVEISQNELLERIMLKRVYDQTAELKAVPIPSLFPLFRTYMRVKGVLICCYSSELFFKGEVRFFAFVTAQLAFFRGTESNGYNGYTFSSCVDSQHDTAQRKAVEDALRQLPIAMVEDEVGSLANCKTELHTFQSFWLSNDGKNAMHEFLQRGSNKSVPPEFLASDIHTSTIAKEDRYISYSASERFISANVFTRHIPLI